MCAGLGLYKLQSGTDGICGRIGCAAEQAVCNAHLDEHGAEIISLGKGFAALLLGHLALAERDHGGDHLFHSFICSGIQDLRLRNIKAAFFRSSLHFVNVSDEDDTHQLFCQKLSSSRENSRIRTLGENNRLGFRLYLRNQFIKHAYPPFRMRPHPHPYMFPMIIAENGKMWKCFLHIKDPVPRGADPRPAKKGTGLRRCPSNQSYGFVRR